MDKIAIFLMREFNKNMYIQKFSINNFISPLFCAKNKKEPSIQTIQLDTVELSSKKESDFPLKLELTDIEKEFNEVLVKYNFTEQNVKTQKQMLKQYYSAQDKYDYQETLKEKNRLLTKLKRIAKKYNLDYMDIKYDIYFKKTYNYYAPKIHKATSIEELNELQEYICEKCRYIDLKQVLLNFIEDRKQRF